MEKGNTILRVRYGGGPAASDGRENTFVITRALSCLLDSVRCHLIACLERRLNGKFILELARAREGEKTSWISVPRKTFWPPTVSSTSANFHKHESSTSLSFSDDNSSIQSSPWQRDHCWKQANPRQNISKELSLYYFRPPNVRARRHMPVSRTWLRRKRRRPYEPSLPSEVKKEDPLDGETSGGAVKKEHEAEATASPTGNGQPLEPNPAERNGEGSTPMDTSDDQQQVPPRDESKEATETKNRNGTKHNGPTEANGHHCPLTNGSHHRASRWKRPDGKNLSSIIQALTEQQQAKSSLASSLGAAAVTASFRTTSERGTNGGTASFRSSVFASSAATQHVSPRKRILRELEKVSLDDAGGGNGSGTTSTKRSRPKSGSAGVGSTPVIHLTNGVPVANSLSPASSHLPPAPPVVSRPFSSYSITSLLGHSSSGSSSGSSDPSSSSDAAAQHRKSDASIASVTSTASHHHPPHHYHQHPLSPHQQSQYQGTLPPVAPKSPTMMDPHHHAHYQARYGGYGAKKRSPSYGGGGGGGSAASPGATSGGSGSADPYGNTIRSPDLSPSPEHHQHHPHHAHHHHSAAHHAHSGGGFSRYRQHPYGGSPSSYSSAPSSARFSPSPSTNDSATTPPYSGSVGGGGGGGASTTPVGGARSAMSYRAAYHLGGNGSQGHSPPASNGSPQHYSRASPLNFGRGSGVHQSSPPPSAAHQHHHHHRASPGGGSTAASHVTTPTSAMASLTTSGSPTTTIRTVPKKTAALRQPFSGGHSPSSSSSPSRERSNSNASSSSVKKESHPEGTDSVDGIGGPPLLLSHYGTPSALPPSTTPATSGGVIRPSTVIASPTAHHPVANPFYSLYPTQLGPSSSAPSMNAAAVAAAAAAAAAASSVSFHPASLTYYQQMYTAATMAAYRTPLWMHYPGLPPAVGGGPPHIPVQPPPPHPHHAPPLPLPPSSSSVSDRRMAISSPPPPGPSSSLSIAEAAESQRLQQHSSASAAALNYSVTALTSSSRATVNGGSAFTSPGWPSAAGAGGGGYQHPEHAAGSAVGATGTASAAVKDEPSNGECLQGLQESCKTRVNFTNV
uniref:Uncharacterized protein n=1 Tax=Anopheles dirus TaxID=7168 RepID=A0A182NCP5_9DIPT